MKRGNTTTHNYEKPFEYERLKKEREHYRLFRRDGIKDYYAYTVCGGCYGLCGVRVRVLDGSPITIEGIPESDMGPQGGLCGKGFATIMDYHDPNRCNFPVKRTNSEKGIGKDPRWRRIPWGEALDTIAKRLREAMEKDPRSILWHLIPSAGGISMKGVISVVGFFVSLGSPNGVAAGSGFCGSAIKAVIALMHASHDAVPDYKYCNYLLRCGGSEGAGGGHAAGIAVRKAADARDRGMKMVVMDPIGYISAAKAAEWIPILPATDSAVLLAIANLIVNEIGVYDAQYIKHKTNGPYLVRPDGLLNRDTETGKPLLWDESDAMPKIYDDPTLVSPAILGEYVVDGTVCHPAFQLLKKHLTKYEPRWASRISTVPEKTIHRIARDLVNEAKIGSTIDVGGVTFPYRPACAVGSKGLTGHMNCFHQSGSLNLLNALLGAQDVPGGALSLGSVRSLGHPKTGRPRFEPFAGYDGMLTPGVWLYGQVPWPPKKPAGPSEVSFLDIFPYAAHTVYPFLDDWNDIWTTAGRPYEPEVLGIFAGNPIMSSPNPKTTESFLSSIPFIFSINTIHNETTEGFADIVLPDCHFLESLEVYTGMGFTMNYPSGLSKWTFHIRAPVVEPKYERRDVTDIFFDLADRLGTRVEYNRFLENSLSAKNMTWARSEVRDFQILNPAERISPIELTDRVLKHYFGEERGLEWFKQHGFIAWNKNPRESYWRHTNNARVPIYFEFLRRDGEKIRHIAEKIGIRMDWDHYSALVSYFPSSLYSEFPAESQYDLIAVSYRDILHTSRFTAENPWINEMSSANPYTYNVLMNNGTAKQKAIDDGDMICLENQWGDKTRGRVKLTQAIHPQVLGMLALGGWAKALPLARGKGVNFNFFMRADHKHMCPVTNCIEQAVRVKAYKVE